MSSYNRHFNRYYSSDSDEELDIILRPTSIKNYNNIRKLVTAIDAFSSEIDDETSRDISNLLNEIKTKLTQRIITSNRSRIQRDRHLQKK